MRQIVGEPCDICKEEICALVNGIACADCQLVFHKTCLGPQQDCPKCHKDVAESVNSAKRSERRVLLDEIRAGKELTLIVCGLLIFTDVAAIVVSVLRFGPELVGRTIGGAVIHVMLVATLFMGFPWARILLQVTTGFSLFMSLLMIITSLNQNAAAGIAEGVISAAFYAFVLICLTASSKVALFLEYQRSGRGPDDR